MPLIIPENLAKAAERGEPSRVWRAGQQRRLDLLKAAAGNRLVGTVLVDGCGVGTYLARLAPDADLPIGLDIEFPRVVDSQAFTPNVICGAGEYLPLAGGSADLVFSHEVLEHVQDDQLAIQEMVRVLKPGGRIVLFCPNRGYPFETHGIYWHGKYHFGNKLFVNYLPRSLRDKLAPHVEIYTRADLDRLFAGLPVRVVSRRTVFGAYDNIIKRSPAFGKLLRAILQWLEKTPLQRLGLSHFWVVEKV
ncbi:MAG TPA: class I SAM-dependent methyltransferase [Anaerolineaceae bacterium]|jgi:SAM-dependent methyltransferase|nr:class I SAM-dependent methyltransferase [Anaerolineaceae bacterium]HPT24215.1 class I SAM-dependent methyltransferase [Anaerolineaceae bacterium]